MKYNQLTCYPKLQSGVGLIELMISMLIGLFIMAGVVQLFGTTSQNAVASAGSNRIQENIRYAFARMADGIAQSGNLGCFSSTMKGPDAENKLVDVNNMLALNNGANQLFDFGTILHGEEDADASWERDSVGGNQIAPGTDTLTIRFASHRQKTPVEAITNDSVTIDPEIADNLGLDRGERIVMVSNCSRAAIFVVTDVSGGVILHEAGVQAVTEDGEVPSPDAQHNSTGENGIYDEAHDFDPDVNNVYALAFLYPNIDAHRYFIGTSVAARGGGSCDRANEGSWQNCALFFREGGRNQELVEGVHDMQITYGWYSPDGKLYVTEADEVEVDDWGAVDRVVITLSFNSIEKAVFEGNASNNLMTKDVSRTFNLPNQL